MRPLCEPSPTVTSRWALSDTLTAIQTLLRAQIDIDLNDPEVEKAATKIQATFRGFQSRRDAPKKEDEN